MKKGTKNRITSAVAGAIGLLCAGLFLTHWPTPDGTTPSAPPAVVSTPSPETAPETSSEPEATAPTESGSLAAVAASLPLIDEKELSDPDRPPYRRDDFGPRWADIDGNGCDQRQDVLARDLDDITTDGCTVLSGTLHDPYTGMTIAFQHDRIAEPGNRGSQGVQGDHIVSLYAADEGGARLWTPERREAFANTLSNILAVDGDTNASKKDRGPAEWMPPNAAFACEYATLYTGIVSEWGLSVHAADRDALTSTLTSCGL